MRSSNTGLGGEGGGSFTGDDEGVGILPRAVQDIFGRLEDRKSTEKVGQYSYEVTCTMLEVYGEEIRDLLTPAEEKSTGLNLCQLRDIFDGPEGSSESHDVEILNSHHAPISSIAECLDKVKKGLGRRVTGSTMMNEHSSRSHAVVSVEVCQRIAIVPEAEEDENGNVADYTESATPPIITISVPTASAPPPRFQTLRSKFHFVDLAGSERQKRSGAEGQRLREGIDINKGLLVSLLALLLIALSPLETKRARQRRDRVRPRC